MELPLPKRLFLALFLVAVNIFLVRSLGSSQSTLTYLEVKQLESQNFSFKDLSDFFTLLAEKKGAEYAFEVLKIASIPPNVDMHLMGHIVGDILYKQKGLEGIKVCTHDFRNACSHSIVIGLLLEQGEGALPKIAEACRQAPGGKGAYTMCFHGLGHGVLAYTEYDLRKAVKLCERTGTEEYHNREYIECVGGSIMEIIAGVHDREAWRKQAEVYLRKEDALYPCKADFIPREAKPICYTYLTPRLFQVAGADLGSPDPKYFEKAFNFCRQLPVNSQDRYNCLAGFGKEFVVLAQDRDIRKIEEMSEVQLAKVYAWCELANDEEGVSACVGSALQSLYWGGENHYKASVKFCKIISNSSLQSQCFDQLIAAVTFYKEDSSYRRDFCNSLPGDYQDRCSKQLTISSKH